MTPDRARFLCAECQIEWETGPTGWLREVDGLRATAD